MVPLKTLKKGHTFESDAENLQIVYFMFKKLKRKT